MYKAFALLLYFYSSLLIATNIEADAFKNKNLPVVSTYLSMKEVGAPRFDPRQFPEVLFVDKKSTELYVAGHMDQGILKFGKAYLVFRTDENGYLYPSGRAVVLDETKIEGQSVVKLICYKFMNNLTPARKDRLAYLGAPLSEREQGDIDHILMSRLNLDRELEDMYHGVMAFRTMLGNNSLSGTSNNDVNAFKKTKPFMMYGFGYTWWFFFYPRLGFDVEYRKGANIKTISYFEKEESSSLSNTALSLMYRLRLFQLPAMFHIKYFIDSFNTTNPDDQLISSKYSGVSLFTQWYFPYKFTIIPLGSTKMVFQDLEIGFGYTPTITVKDQNFERGVSVSGASIRYHGGIMFNFETEKTSFIKDIFFGMVVDMITYSLSFAGPTTGGIPQGTVNSEKYFYWGFMMKYVFSDPFEDF